jgi:hypothetical protein
MRNDTLKVKFMSTSKNNCYVYCYIDPRTNKIFYYGKGTWDRKFAHFPARGKSEKANKIRRIERTGKEPLVRVIAADLTDEQALLVEETLIWKSREQGEKLTNEISGNYAESFRPSNTLDEELEGFDFSHQSHFFNVGEQFNDEEFSCRYWDDCIEHGFVTTGCSPGKREQACQLHKGDVVLAYYKGPKGHGYVGIGKVTVEAKPACKFRIGNKSLKQMIKQRQLRGTDIVHDYHDLDKCEYVTRVKWLAPKKPEVLWKKGLFYARSVRVSLENQPGLRGYIEKKWHVKFADLLKQD